MCGAGACGCVVVWDCPPPPAGAQTPAADERGAQLGSATWTFDYDDPNDTPPEDYQALADNFNYNGRTGSVTIFESEDLTRMVDDPNGDPYEEVYANKITVWCHAKWVCTWNGKDLSEDGIFTAELLVSTVPDEVPYEAPDQSEIDAAPLSVGTVDPISDDNRNVQQYSYPAWTQCGEDISYKTHGDKEVTSEPDLLEWALLFSYYESDVPWIMAGGPTLTAEQDRVWKKWLNDRSSLTSDEAAIFREIPGRSDLEERQGPTQCLLTTSQQFTSRTCPGVDVPQTWPRNIQQVQRCIRESRPSYSGDATVFYTPLVKVGENWVIGTSAQIEGADADDVYRRADAGKPVADVLPLVKPVIYYCALDGDELRDRTCYRNIVSQVHAAGTTKTNRSLSEYQDGAETDGSLPSLTAPRESGFPKYEMPAEQDIVNCGFDAGCVDALYVKAYNDFERAAELWDAQQQRFQQEIDKRIEAGESFWVCMDIQDWQKRVSGETGLERILTPDRCYLIN